jgi:hypothetical protein
MQILREKIDCTYVLVQEPLYSEASNKPLLYSIIITFHLGQKLQKINKVDISLLKMKATSLFVSHHSYVFKDFI